MLGKKNQVDWELERLRSVSTKLNDLKEQMRIHIIGFGWCDIHITWSYKGTVKSPESLSVIFKTITKEEKSCPITNEPLINLP